MVVSDALQISLHVCPSLQEVCQAIEQLKPRLMALCSALKRLGEGIQLDEEVVNLQKQQAEFIGKAAEKQSTLESLLALWQRYSKYKYVLISPCILLIKENRQTMCNK